MDGNSGAFDLVELPVRGVDGFSARSQRSSVRYESGLRDESGKLILRA